MCAEMNNAASIVVARISVLANQDAEFRSALADILNGLLGVKQVPEDDRAMAEEVSPPIEIDERQQTEPDGETDVVPVEQPAAIPQVGTTAIRRLPRKPNQPDLSGLEVRYRLKAEGARWAAERQRCINQGLPVRTAIVPRDEELIAKAKQLNCFLWANGPNAPRLDNLDLFNVLAECFEAAADAVKLLRDYAVQVEDGDLFKQCLELAAEAQSALRSAVMAVGGRNDEDQVSLYDWLRTTATEYETFVKRYMCADDLADPYSGADIQSRIQAIREACQKVLDRQKLRTDQVKRVRYHAKLVDAGGGTDHDWQTIVRVVDEAVRDGMPPSNREIREALLPIIDSLSVSDEFPPSFHLVLREAKKYQAEQNTQLPCMNDVEPTADVQAVRKFLEGTTLVIIGGDSRDHSQQSIKDVFTLKEVLWLPSREHQSVERFKPYIKRDDVKVVVLLIRWASHSYGDLKPVCDLHGKLFVRVPGGYSPNQIANNIIAQCGGPLGQDMKARCNTSEA